MTNPKAKMLSFQTTILADNIFQAYSMANGRSLWSVKYDGDLSYASTPIYYGLSFFGAVNGRILKVSAKDGEKQFILEDPKISPKETCAPLLVTRNDGVPDKEKALAVFGLKEHILIYDLLKNTAKFQPHDVMGEDSLRSPALCDERLVFTTKLGKIYEFSLEGEKIRIETLGVAGEREFGGDDVTQAIVDLILEK